MTWLRFSVFIIFFFSDIQFVKAAPVAALFNDSDVVQEPVGCLQESSRCALKTRAGFKYRHRFDSHDVVLGSDSGILQLDGQTLSLLRGRIWASTEAKLKIQVPSGTIELSQGQALIDREEKRTRVRIISGTALISRIGGGESVSLEPGFENWLGGVLGQGQVAIGIPISIHWQDLVLSWGPIFVGTSEEFKDALDSFRPVWSAALDKAGELHREKATRDLAAIEERRMAEMRAKWKIEQERRELKRRFWEHTFVLPRTN